MGLEDVYVGLGRDKEESASGEGTETVQDSSERLHRSVAGRSTLSITGARVSGARRDSAARPASTLGRRQLQGSEVSSRDDDDGDGSGTEASSAEASAAEASSAEAKAAGVAFAFQVLAAAPGASQSSESSTTVHRLSNFS